MRIGVLSLTLLVLAIFLSSSFADRTMQSGGPRPPPRPQRELDAGTAELRDRLLALADSDALQAHDELVRELSRNEVLDRLDPPSVRDKSRSSDLLVARVLAHLRDNQVAHTGATLSRLCANPAFTAHWQRAELLVRALGTRRPLAAESLAFLEHQSTPDSVNLHVVVSTLMANRTPAALALFSRLLANENIDRIYRVGWLRTDLLEQRRAPEILVASKQWLTDPALPQEIKQALAEALFDYRPDAWYPGREGLPRPPDEASIANEAKPALRAVARLVLDANYSKALNARVREVLAKSP